MALAGEIVAAVVADENNGGCDISAGMFGPAFSALIRKIATEYVQPAAAQEAVGWQRSFKYPDGSNGPWCSITKESYDETISGKWAHKYDVRELYAAPVAAAPVEFDRARETPRRQRAVELLLSMGYNWNDGAWSSSEVARAQVNLDARWYARREKHARDMGYASVCEALDALESMTNTAAPGIDHASEIESLKWQLDRANNTIEVLTSAQKVRDKVAEVIDASHVAAAQEAVGYRWRHSANEPWKYSNFPRGWEHQPLYAAPVAAAPGIDLGQFRESVECLYSKRLSEYEDGQHSDADMQAYEVERRRLLSLIDASPKGGITMVNNPPNYTTGHCENHKKPGGCPLHNLQCGYPQCDRRQATSHGAGVSE